MYISDPKPKRRITLNTIYTMAFHCRSLDEREAASIVAGLHSNNAPIGVASVARTGTEKKRSHSRDNGNGNASVNDEKRVKKRRKPATATEPSSSAARGKRNAKAKKNKEPPMDATGLIFAQPELKPAPFFYYTDHSLEEDDDPLTPITVAGSVPTFPASECVHFVSFAYPRYF